MICREMVNNVEIHKLGILAGILEGKYYLDGLEFLSSLYK